MMRQPRGRIFALAPTQYTCPACLPESQAKPRKASSIGGHSIAPLR